MNNKVSVFNPFGLSNSFFDDFFNNERKTSSNHIMKTDIKDNGNHYEFSVELPSVKKENIHLSLENGYLTIEASISKNNDEKETTNYIHQERYYGSFSRSYYVGNNIKKEDIKAKLDSGILTLLVKKETEKTPESNYIEIE